MLKAAGEKGIEIVTDLITQIMKEGTVPVEWTLLPIVIKGKKNFGQRKLQRVEADVCSTESP